MREKESAFITFISKSPEETMLLGELLATALKGGDIISLTGELGAGKTVLIKGICKSLGVKENVSSSSFVLMRVLSGTLPVYHFDLYRLNDEEELRELGCDEYLFSDGISLIEWAEKLGGYLNGECLRLTLEYLPEKEEFRTISLMPSGERYRKLLEEITIPLERLE